MNQPNSSDAPIGRVLGGQYRIESLLGQGGMGAVYRGVQLSVNRTVAIKLIIGGTPNQAELVQRFRREAEATAKLSHPNTVRLFDFGVTENQELYMVMELLEGTDLSAHLQARGALPLPEALHITRQILQALSEAHAFGIVHRDLKPGNVFMSRVQGGESVVKVMDFGIAGIEQARETQKLTMTGAVIGTPAYMSPEQAQGKGVDPRSDLYSLGVMLFEMLTGRPPFEADTVVSLLLAHVTQAPPRLQTLRADLPNLGSAQALLDRLLAKVPEGRPASASSALESLDVLANGGVVPAPSPASLLGPTQLAPAGAQLGTQPATPLTWSVASAADGGMALPKRNTKLAALAAGGALAVAAIGYFATRPSTPEPSVVKPAVSVGEPPQAEDGTVTHSVTIASKPNGATVMLNGAELGKTPVAVQFRHDTVLGVSLAGYVAQSVTLTAATDPNLVVSLAPQSPSASAARSSAKPTANPTASPTANLVRPASRSGTSTTAKSTATPVAAAAPSGNTEPPRAERIELPPGRTEPVASTSAPLAPPPAEEPPPPPTAARRTPVGQVTHAVGGLVSSIFGGRSNGDARTRREAMRDGVPPYSSVAAAKHALDAGQISAQEYADVIWALKARRKQRIEAEKRNLKSGVITGQEYKWRVQRIDAEYQGS